MENDKKTDFGTMTGIVIVVIILLVGAYYFAEQRVQKQREFQNKMNQNETATSSDSISDIEKDANSMNFDNLGSDINNL